MRETPATRRMIVLGATGSVGTQTLNVVDHLNALHARGEWPTRYQVVGLASSRSSARLEEALRRCADAQVAVADPEAAPDFEHRTGVAPRVGSHAAEAMVRELDCDLVVSAISGSAGLRATFAAVELGRDVALANKETLVAAGALIVPAAQSSGSRLLPVDSEHSGVWQCLAGRHDGDAGSDGAEAPPLRAPRCLRRVVLTASGGPFRTASARDIHNATPEQALKHPTWTMGPKVTIDSASLMNKSLEIIEAHWLFGLAPERIDVLIHPQSIVHAIAEFEDGSAIAQLGAPDMHGPIQYALTFPRRPAGVQRRIHWSETRSLDFEAPDHARFPSLQLAYRAIRGGGTLGATLNAANEAAVEEFLAGRIPFGRITGMVAEAMDTLETCELRTLGDALQAESRARSFVRTLAGK